MFRHAVKRRELNEGMWNEKCNEECSFVAAEANDDKLTSHNCTYHMSYYTQLEFLDSSILITRRACDKRAPFSLIQFSNWQWIGVNYFAHFKNFLSEIK